MLVNVPFVYRMLHRGKGKRIPKWVSVRDSMPVSFVEFTEADAPLAFEAGGSPGFVPHPARHIHRTSDRLVSPLFGTNVGNPDNALITATKTTVHEMVKLPGDRRNPFTEAQYGRGAGSFTSEKTIEDFADSKIIETNRETRMAEIARYAADFCFVGDVLCVDAQEPVWHAIANETFAAVVLRRHPLPAEQVFPGAAIYRADRLDAAMAHARRKAEEFGLDPSVVTVEGSLVVVLPRAVSFDDENHSLVEAAREGVNWRLKPEAHDLDVPMAEFDLALASGRGNETTAKAVEDLISWLRDHDLGEHDARLREYIWRRRDLPETASRNTAELEVALADVDMDMLK